MGEGMNDLEKKPCPFCGYHASVIIDNKLHEFQKYKIVCWNDICKMQSPWLYTEYEAIEMWNRRA